MAGFTRVDRLPTAMLPARRPRLSCPEGAIVTLPCSRLLGPDAFQRQERRLAFAVDQATLAQEGRFMTAADYEFFLAATRFVFDAADFEYAIDRMMLSEMQSTHDTAPMHVQQGAWELRKHMQRPWD